MSAASAAAAAAAATGARYQGDRKKLAFNVHNYKQFVNSQKQCSCSKFCFRTINKRKLDTHAKALDLFLTCELPPSERARLHAAWLLSIYMLCINDKGNITQFRIPAFGDKGFCRTAWEVLMNVKTSTLTDYVREAKPYRDVVRKPHGNVEQQRALKPEARVAVKEFVMLQAHTHGHSLPMYMSSADGRELAPDESITVLPPHLSKRGLWALYSNAVVDKPQCKVSWPSFRYLLESECPSVRVSRSARGICDMCMAMRVKLRMVDEDKVNQLCEQWNEHLSMAVDSRDVHNSGREAAKEAMDGAAGGQRARVDISFDMAKQAYVPNFPAGTTADFFKQKQGLDVNLCGFMDEGRNEQMTFIMTEGAKHDSNAIASMLHHYMTHVNADAGTANELHLHMDSCTGQNKNNIMLGYCMLRVLHKKHQKLCLYYMTVGHTKFGPDRIFGVIRNAMKRDEALSVPEFKQLVDKCCGPSSGYVYDHKLCRDYKTGVAGVFKPLPNFRKKFYYRIEIVPGRRDDGTRTVFVEVFEAPKHCSSTRYDLLKINDSWPGLEDDNVFPRVPCKVLGNARRRFLRSDLYEHIKTRCPNREADVDEWWQRYLDELDAAAGAAAGSCGALVVAAADEERVVAEAEVTEPVTAVSKSPPQPATPAQPRPKKRKKPEVSPRSGAGVLTGQHRSQAAFQRAVESGEVALGKRARVSKKK